MRRLKSLLRQITFLRSAKLFWLRLRTGIAHLGDVSKLLLVWLFNSREVSNFTYDLTQLNKRYLSAQVADITGQSYDQIMGYIMELETDQQLHAHIGESIRKAGYLLSGLYREFGEICYGDAIETLKKLSLTIDLFINDSDHSAAYEGREYQTIAAMLGAQAIVLGDNSHATGELLSFAQKTGRQFIFFREQPVNHWYPGAGIGVAFRR